MPRGVPVNQVLHCKKCEGSQFTSISELRKHQWAVHANTFDNLRKAARAASTKAPGAPKKGQFRCAVCGKRFDSMANVQRHNWKAHRSTRMVAVRRRYSAQRQLPAVPLVHNGDMKVADLLAELRHQQKFIDDVISLISGIVTRHQEKTQ